MLVQADHSTSVDSENKSEQFDMMGSSFFFSFFFSPVLQDTASLCSPDCPAIYHAGLELKDMHAPASQVLVGTS